MLEYFLLFQLDGQIQSHLYFPENCNTVLLGFSKHCSVYSCMPSFSTKQHEGLVHTECIFCC